MGRLGRQDRRPPHAAVFYFDAPIELTADDRLDIELKHESDNREHVIGRFRLALSSEPSASLDEFDPSLRLALEKPKQERSAEEKSLIESEYFQSDEQYRTLDRRQNELQEKRKALLGKVPKVMVMEQRDKHRDTMMLDRAYTISLAIELSLMFPQVFRLLPLTSQRTG